jgi:hypothetical protein
LRREREVDIARRGILCIRSRGPGQLAILKARTWLARDGEKDLEDFKFLLIKMGEMGESFGASLFVSSIRLD